MHAKYLRCFNTAKIEQLFGIDQNRRTCPVDSALTDMQLSAKQLHQIMATLRSSSNPATKDKRQEPRVGFRTNVHIQSVAGNAVSECEQVALRDLSKTGLGILRSQPVAIHSRFVVKMLDEARRPDFLLVCTVRNCRKVAAIQYAIGAMFVEHAPLSVRWPSQLTPK